MTEGYQKLGGEQNESNIYGVATFPVRFSEDLEDVQW